MEAKRGNFLGTYFSKDIVLKLASISKLFSWIVVGIYACQLFVQFVTNILSIARGFWTGMGYTDIAMSFIIMLELPLRGVVYFIVLQAVAQVLLLFMDLEDNTRRVARSAEQSRTSNLPTS